TFLLKVRALTASGKSAEAGNLLDTLPDRDAGGETTSMLLEHYLDSGQAVKAAVLAEKVFERDPKQYAVVHRAAGALLEAGPNRAARVARGSLRTRQRFLPTAGRARAACVRL